MKILRFVKPETWRGVTWRGLVSPSLTKLHLSRRGIDGHDIENAQNETQIMLPAVPVFHVCYYDLLYVSFRLSTHSLIGRGWLSSIF